MMVCFTLSCPERSDIKYTWMLPPIYQNIVNLIASLSIRKYPGKFMNVMMWEHCILDNYIFGCGTVYYSKSLSLLILCKLSFPIISSKISSLSTLAFKSLKNIVAHMATIYMRQLLDCNWIYYTHTLKYNWVSLDSLSLTTHNWQWVSHNNSVTTLMASLAINRLFSQALVNLPNCLIVRDI
jgi:hypothetical protein